MGEKIARFGTKRSVRDGMKGAGRGNWSLRSMEVYQ